MPHRRNIVAWTVIGALMSLVVPILGSAMIGLAFPEFRLTQLPLHSLIEGAGGLIALCIAGILYIEFRHKQDSDHYPWIVAGLLSMGVLDLFHAASTPGNAFVWLRATASLCGGVCFGLTWIAPSGPRPAHRLPLFPVVVAMLAMAFGGVSLLASSHLPDMRTAEGRFSTIAVALNIASGCGFSAATAFFVRRFFKTCDVEDWIFGMQTALFGAAGFLFSYSAVWNGGWWWWHVLRLAAYAAALTYGLRTFRDAERELRRVNQTLEATNATLDQTVEERTAKLRAVEERFELAVRGSTDGLWDWDVLTNEVFFSPRMKELLGYEEHEMHNDFAAFETRLHPDDHDWVLRAVDEHLKLRKPYDVEYRLQRKSGEYRWFRARGQAVWDDAGKPLRMAGSLTDITDRQRADAERQKFVWLANNSHDFIGMCDTAFVPFYVNTAGLKLVGLPDVESACRAKVQDYFFPEDRDFITNDFFPRVLRDGHGEVEIRFRHFQTHEPIWMLFRLINLIDQSGSVIGWATISTNITERKRAEERFRRVVEAAPNAIVMIDRQRKITLVNRRTEELFGYSRDELIGQAIEVLVPERFRPNHPELVEQFLQQPQARTMGANRNLFGRKKDGGEVPIEIGLNPMTTSEGFFVLASVIDITERKRVEDALRAAKEAADAANKLKSSFLANMSHEIRTPMNGIIGMAQLLARTELRSHQRDYLATIDESAHILLRLLNDILDFSKIEAGKLELEVAEFRLSECLARATQMLVLRAAEKGLEIACRIAPEIPDHLRGDAGRLQQVLVNLLGNAVKFTEAGEIFVNVNAESLASDRVRLRFSVSDTGIGVAPDKHDQIFHPFEQAESSTTRRFGGTGLGLTISRQLVEMMHGRIWLDSEVGRGSTFHFSAEFEVSADQHLHTPTELERLINLPVLVVDDNFTNRRILGEMLQHWHMQPILTDSAPAAREALRKAAESQHPIRLILLDHHMPGEDGFHFVESVTDLLRREPCTIIMISSGSSPLDADQCQKHGIDRFMTKPLIASELLNEVLKQFGTRTAITASEPPIAAAARIQPRRVLLVEDNEINRRVAIGLIRSRGHQVVVAENGQVALDTLADQEFDVVLMDMQMPVLDGYEATALIRQREHKTGGHVPIVAMTAEALKGDRERCLATGMDDYIAKPISPDELYRAVERFPALCLPAETGTFGSDSPAASSVSETVNVSGSSPLPTSPVDWNVARRRLGSEPKLLREFCDLMKSQTPSLLSDIRRAIETRDFKLLRRAAHTLKGSVSYFGAESLAQSALALEKVGREEILDGAPAMLTVIEQELARVLDALAAGPPEVATS